MPRIDAASALLSSYDTDFIVAHVGQHAVVLRPYELHADDVVITTGAVGLMPGGLHVPEDLFPVWASQRAGALLTITTDARSLSMFERVSLELGSVRCDVAAVGLAAATLDASEAARHEFDWKARAAVLAHDACAGDRDGVEAAVSSLVGRGAGSTPTGDDVLVGVCAALRMSGRPGASVQVAACAVDLAHRTTRSSRLFLRAAEGGRFSERVHRLAGALTDARQTSEVMDALQSWGATSGQDLALGMLGGLSAIAHDALAVRAGRSA